MNKIIKVSLAFIVAGILIFSLAGAGTALSLSINVENSIINPGQTINGNVTIIDMGSVSEISSYQFEILCSNSELDMKITDAWDMSSGTKKGTVTITGNKVMAYCPTLLKRVSCADGQVLCNFTITAPANPLVSTYVLSLREDYDSGSTSYAKNGVPVLVVVDDLQDTSKNVYHTNATIGSSYKIALSSPLNPVTILLKSLTTLNFKFMNGTVYTTGSVMNGDTKVMNTTSLCPVQNGFTFKGWYLASNTNTQILNTAGNFASNNIPGYVTSGKWVNESSSLDIVAKYDLDLTGTNLSGKSTVTLNSDGSYTIALSSDITNTVVIPDTWGNVTLNLNGKSIKPSTAGADGLVFADKGTGIGTNLMVIGTGAILGANGAVPGGNGGNGIASESGADTCTLALASTVTVSGGNGAAGSAATGAAAGTAGGNGGSGINAAAVTKASVEGIVSGGNGGVGGKAENGTAGAGGAGGVGSTVVPTSLVNGTLSGGDGGNGGDATGVSGTAGNGGNGGQSASSVMSSGKSSIYNGIGGTGGKNTASGTSASSGSSASTPTVTPVESGSVIGTVTEFKGDAESVIGIGISNIGDAVDTSSGTDSYIVDVIVTGTNATSTGTSMSLCAFVKSNFPQNTAISSMNLTVSKQVVTGGASGPVILMNETDSILEIFISYVTSGKDIRVYRQHEGVNLSFTKDNAKVDGHFHTTSSGVVLYSKYFSDFAIASRDTPTPVQTPSPKTTSSSSSSKVQSGSQILPSNAYADKTPEPTATPTPVATSLPVPTSSSTTSSVYPTSASPAPLLGLIAGLGTVVAVFGIRRIRR